MKRSPMPNRRTSPKRRQRVHPIRGVLTAEGPHSSGVGYEDLAEREIRSSPEYRAVVDEAAERSGGRCEIRSDRCNGGAVDPHHRWPTSEGGPVIVPAFWLVAVCRSCHAWVHGANTRPDAEALGWITPRRRGAG